MRSRRTRQLVLLAALAVSAWTIAVWATGGIHVEPFGVRLSSTDPVRPLVVACLLFAVYAWRWPVALRSHVCAMGEAILRHQVLAVGAIVAVVVVVATTTGSTVASAADPYGYVSQAALWRQGRLTVPIDLIARVPWPNPQWTFSPLGYRPSPTHSGAIIPTYAPGLPLLMALAQLIGGYGAAFLVVPLAGAVLVWLTYALGRRVFEWPGLAVWGALLVALSPTFLFQTMWPMTDVPVAAMWTAALVLALDGRPLVAGLAMAAALAIRPNLVLLPASLIGWALVHGLSHHEGWQRFRSAAWLTVGVTPAVVGIAALNSQLYGSPLASGYGDAAGIFQIGRLSANASRYSTWLLATETPLVLCAAVFFVVPRWCSATRARLPRLLLGGTMLAAVGSYLTYEIFNDWWYLRFLLPMWPALMLSCAAGFDGVFRRWMPLLRPFVLMAAIAFLAWNGLQPANTRVALGVGRGERRYVDAARFVDAQTEPDAVILSMQHSGSIRQYAGRLTLRYDSLAEGWLDRAASYLQSIGRHPYILVDDWEVEPFRRKHAATSRLGRLDWAPLGTMKGWNDVALYDAVDVDRPMTTRPMPTVTIDQAMSWPVPLPHPGAAALR